MPDIKNVKTFTRRTPQEIRDYVVSLIDGLCEKYDTEKWTSRESDDLGMLFVDLTTSVGDLLNFYISNQARENYLTSAVQRKNMKRILSLVNYKIRGPEPAITRAMFSIAEPRNYDIVIPKYFQVCYSDPVSTQNNVYYATNEECCILAGEDDVQVDIVQGVVHTVDTTVGDISNWRTTTIMDDNVANKSVTVTIDGEKWTEVPDILYEEDDSKKYSVYENLNDQTVIEFGYNWRSSLPGNPKAPVKIKYLTTLGAIGGISANRINTVVDSLAVNGIDVNRDLVVTNLYDATGGADRETIDEARIKAPHIVKSRQLMATLKDYEYFAEDIPGVYKARAVDWNIENGKYVAGPYRVDLRVVPDDTYAYIPSLPQRDHIKEVLKPYTWSAMDLKVIPPDIYSIDLIIKVYTTIPESQYAGLRRELTNAYNDYFNKFKRSFGETFYISQFENIAMENDDVSVVEVLAPDKTVELEVVEFPKLGKVDIAIDSI